MLSVFVHFYDDNDDIDKVMMMMMARVVMNDGLKKCAQCVCPLLVLDPSSTTQEMGIYSTVRPINIPVSFMFMTMTMITMMTKMMTLMKMMVPSFTPEPAEHQSPPPSTALDEVSHHQLQYNHLLRHQYQI